MKQRYLKEDLKWVISKIPLKNASSHRTQNVDLYSTPSQLKQTWRTPGWMDLIVFLICTHAKVRGGLQMEIAQSDPCTFSVDETPPEAPTARHHGTQQRRKHTI